MSKISCNFHESPSFFIRENEEEKTNGMNIAWSVFFSSLSSTMKWYVILNHKVADPTDLDEQAPPLWWTKLNIGCDLNNITFGYQTMGNSFIRAEPTSENKNRRKKAVGRKYEQAAKERETESGSEIELTLTKPSNIHGNVITFGRITIWFAVVQCS